MPANREFTSNQGIVPAVRNVDNDAPIGMLREIINVIFHLTEHTRMGPQPRYIYNIACQSLGIEAIE